MTNKSIIPYDDAQLSQYDQIVRIALGLTPEVPDAVVRAVGLLALRYGLDPANKEVMVINLGKKRLPKRDAQGNIMRNENGWPIDGPWAEVWSPYVGLAGLQRSANRTAPSQHRTEMLSPEEVKSFRGDLYDSGDVGVKVTLWRMDHAKEWAAIGVPYVPVVAYGFWRVKAVAKYDSQGNITGWTKDTIPNTMTAFSVAERRARRQAIKQAFDLDIPDAYGDDAIEEARAQLDHGAVEGEVLESGTFTIDATVAALLETGDYTLSQVLAMDDDQRKKAMLLDQHLKIAEAAWTELSDEEKRARFAKNQDEMYGGRAKGIAAMRAPAPDPELATDVEPDPPTETVFEYGVPALRLAACTTSIQVKTWIEQVLKVDRAVATEMFDRAWKGVGSPKSMTNELRRAILETVGGGVPEDYVGEITS